MAQLFVSQHALCSLESPCETNVYHIMPLKATRKKNISLQSRISQIQISNGTSKVHKLLAMQSLIILSQAFRFGVGANFKSLCTLCCPNLFDTEEVTSCRCPTTVVTASCPCLCFTRWMAFSQ